ncbi:MAG TPA: hypothetical protein VEG42_04130 [Thermoplasmata archaeon]|nr:hypothetical protein [Thermoplasmata archaeon]
MNLSTVIFLCIVAALAAGTSIAVGSNAGVAVPAAAIAVGAAAFLLVVILDRTQWPSRGTRLASPATSVRIRTAFTARDSGRAEILDTLDSLDRSGRPPTRQRLSAEQFSDLVSGSPRGFREFVSARLDELERQR